MYCTQCGHRNPEDANFCGNCGRPLRAGDATTGALPAEDLRTEPKPAGELGAQEALRAAGEDDPSSIVADLAAGTALLVAVRGANQGARFLLDRDVVTVGRHPDSDIFLDDITVSRRHAEFRRDAQRYWVHDVGSLNGTYVDGVRAEDQLLKTGDEVQIGKFKLVVFAAEGP
jgi:pSer/pThr/pTyr-binding forkhead associated (FHA) protein